MMSLGVAVGIAAGVAFYLPSTIGLANWLYFLSFLGFAAVVRLKPSPLGRASAVVLFVIAMASAIQVYGLI